MKDLEKAIELLRKQKFNDKRDSYLDNAIQLVINEIASRKQEDQNKLEDQRRNKL